MLTVIVAGARRYVSLRCQTSTISSTRETSWWNKRTRFGAEKPTASNHARARSALQLGLLV